MKHAAVDMRAGKVFVRSVHETLAGTDIIQNDVVTLDDDDFERIGSAVRTALQAFRKGVPIPPRESMVAYAPSALYPAAGVRNWREFVEGAKSLSIKSDDGHITLTPWKNVGAQDGFVPLKGRDRTISETSPNSDLGMAVIAAFADAE